MIATPAERRVLTYGSFDRLSIGHVRFLRRLAGLGDRLIVGLATDRYNMRRHCPSVLSFDERSEILLSCQYVDHVIPQEGIEQKRSDIVDYDISVLAMGDEWSGKLDGLNDLVQVLYLPRAPLGPTSDPTMPAAPTYNSLV